ncbi:MAG TPA: hypothetical protein VHM31_09650, partial [Polyangia bacterium]|nr:hypothetical protein [Polyangia bacterium]
MRAATAGWASAGLLASLLVACGGGAPSDGQGEGGRGGAPATGGATATGGGTGGATGGAPGTGG